MTTKPQPFTFVLMPFSEEYDDVYNLGIRPACIDNGSYAERIDEQIFTENILFRIYNQISKADFIVADMSERNPNVFYEVGYAHALGKQVILLATASGDIPFDLKHYPHIIYNGKITTLKKELGKRIKWLVDNPREILHEQSNSLVFYINGKKYEEGMVIETTISRDASYMEALSKYEFSIGVNNPTDLIIEIGELEVGLITPTWLVPDKEDLASQISSTQQICIDGFGKSILPGGWKSINLKYGFRAGARTRINRPVSIILREFSRFGTIDYPFKFLITKE